MIARNLFLFVGWTSVGLAFLDIFDRPWSQAVGSHA